jgi:hypothetical protein
MKSLGSILLPGAIMVALCWSNLMAQNVHVTSDRGVTTLSVMAQKPYPVIAAGPDKTPTLSVVCRQKGHTITHAIAFSPAGMLTQQEYSSFGKSASLVLEMTTGEHKQTTTWVGQGDFTSFEYAGRTEAERMQFLQSLLRVPTVSIDFTPFLTGAPATSTFDLSGLRTELAKHPECAVK